MKIVEGQLHGPGLRVAIVAGRFNAFIVDRLVEGAADALRHCGVSDSDLTVYRAPGVFELPQLCRLVIERGSVDAVVCIGAVIRGGTPHFEYVCAAVTAGIAELARTSSVPVTLGVLTTDTTEQAIERAGTKAGNKGADAAMAAVEMAVILRSLVARR